MKSGKTILGLILSGVILGSNILSVNAATTPTPTLTPALTASGTPANTSFQVSPSQVVMQVNDLGKVYTLTLTNNTGTAVDLSAYEGLVAQNDDGTVVPLDTQVTKSFLEISPLTVTINDGASSTLTVRTKIIPVEANGQFPAVVIKQAATGTHVGIGYTFYVPFIVQNTSGDLSMSTDLKIDADRFTFSPDLKINGTVSNIGAKFFTPSGSVLVIKNGVKLSEQEVTSQLGGILFANKSKAFTVNWVNPDQSFKAVGEYTIQTRLSNDLSDKTTVSMIKFIYIPMQLVYIVAGALGVVLLLVVISSVIRGIKKKKSKKPVQNYNY